MRIYNTLKEAYTTAMDYEYTPVILAGGMTLLLGYFYFNPAKPEYTPLPVKPKKIVEENKDSEELNIESLIVVGGPQPNGLDKDLDILEDNAPKLIFEDEDPYDSDDDEYISPFPRNPRGVMPKEQFEPGDDDVPEKKKKP